MLIVENSNNLLLFSTFRIHHTLLFYIMSSARGLDLAPSPRRYIYSVNQLGFSTQILTCICCFTNFLIQTKPFKQIFWSFQLCLALFAAVGSHSSPIPQAPISLPLSAAFFPQGRQLRQGRQNGGNQGSNSFGLVRFM